MSERPVRLEPEAEAELQRVLDDAATRLLRERLAALDRDAPGPAPRSDHDTPDDR